jgi:hypothetical protein
MAFCGTSVGRKITNSKLYQVGHTGGHSIKGVVNIA